MANQQSTTGNTGQTGRHEHTTAGRQGTTAMAEPATGVRDQTYNLISVLYHALQGGETTMKYLQDARHEGDHELVEFFQEIQECQRHLASRTREMLMRQMQQGNGHNGGQHMQSRQDSKAYAAGQGQTTAGQQGMRSGDEGMAGAPHQAQDRERRGR